MMDSSTFKRFTASIENILDNLEDMDFTAFGKINLKHNLLVLCLAVCWLFQRIQKHDLFTVSFKSGTGVWDGG